MDNVLLRMCAAAIRAGLDLAVTSASPFPDAAHMEIAWTLRDQVIRSPTDAYARRAGLAHSATVQYARRVAILSTATAPSLGSAFATWGGRVSCAKTVSRTPSVQEKPPAPTPGAVSARKTMTISGTAQSETTLWAELNNLEGPMAKEWALPV